MKPLIRLLVLLAAIIPSLVAATVYSVRAGDSEGLVAALTAANESAQADIIVLERGFYLFGQRHGDSALPTLRGQLRIIGNGAELRRYAHEDFRLFEVAADAHVRIDGLVLAEGSLGAVLNHGRLECHRCQFIDNTDRRSLAIIENYGELHLQDSDVSFNTLANARRDAGTIVNYGDVRIQRSRLHANDLSRRSESLALASAVLNYGNASLDRVRISENSTGLEQSGFSTGSVVNLGKGRAQLQQVIEQDNLPVASVR